MISKPKLQRIRAAVASIPWITPTVLLIMAIVAFPAAYSVYLSFVKVNRIGQIAGFAGWSNYLRLFNEAMFGHIMLNTALWLVVVVVGTMVVSLALASLLNGTGWGRQFLRFSLIVPWAAALVMTSLVWRFILEGRSGVLNRVLNDLGLISGYPDWYKDPTTAFASVMVVGIITSIPFTTFVILGGLKTVPAELVEAARVDGASAWSIWRRITIPSIRPTIFVAMVLNLLHVFNAFTVIWVITGAGAGNVADTTITWMYKIAFVTQLDTGEAAALGVLNVIFLVALILIYMRWASPIETDKDRTSRLALRARAMAETVDDALISLGVKVTRIFAPLGRSLTRLIHAISKPVANTVSVIIGVFFLAPYLVMFLSSLKTTNELWSMPATYLPDRWMWSNYVEVFTQIPLADYFRVSLTVALASTALVLLVAVPAAYAASRLRFRGRTAFLGLILVTQMFPGIALIIGLYQEALLLNAIGEYWFIIVVNTAFNLAFAVWILFANLSAIPLELDEAATLDGLGRFGTLVRILLPLISGGLVTVAIFSFIGVWNEFMIALTIFNQPGEGRVVLTVGIQRFVGVFETNYQYLFAASLMAIIPAVILFALIQRRLVGGLTAGSLK
ncbi:ABC transporter permease subunit [Microbacterium sp. YY-01]|uniref:ABC transporter permease n=1 Tax=Microbacterium sp. YY-01 TaxID=3421634 RepID=UPI003D16984F